MTKEGYVAVLKDDGESASVAIAISRGWAIATDDKAATNLFRRGKLDLEILSTPDTKSVFVRTIIKS